ncbi:MAG: hypothetical protein HC809_17120 [Gammaproteobacteria bacterium]|nr:hypothetical protein [Gammaproteobacteria bacterium]
MQSTFIDSRGSAGILDDILERMQQGVVLDADELAAQHPDRAEGDTPANLRITALGQPGQQRTHRVDALGCG